jgi:Tol biopolymer transport system component
MKKIFFCLFLLIALLLPVQLLAEEAKVTPGSFRLAFVSAKEGQSNIYLINDDGSNLVKLTNSEKKEDIDSPIWSPDGERIMFQKYINLSVLKGKHELWMMNKDGSDPIKILEDIDYNFKPVWSPDGNKILLMVRKENKFGLAIYDIKDQTVLPLANGKWQTIYFDKLSWSLDSKKILGVFKANDQICIYLLDVTEGTLTKLTPDNDDFTYYGYPVWSPDGSKIAYCKLTKGLLGMTSGVYLMNPDGSDETLIGKTWVGKGEIVEISWAPDSTAIIYGYKYCNINDPKNPVTMEVTGANLTKATWSPNSKKIAITSAFQVNVFNAGEKKPLKIKISLPFGEPQWSPDSNKIACVGTSPSPSHIYIATADGNTIVRLTSKEMGSFSPVWAPVKNLNSN